MNTLLQDLRFGLRMLLKRPGFTLVSVITLSLGIGVNTALFTGFNLLLRPAPVKDPDTVVKIECQSGDAIRNFSYLEYVYFRDHAQTLSDFLPTFEEKLLLGEQKPGVEPEEIKGIFASDNYLSTLGGNAQLGRFFTPEENREEGRDAVVVLSYHFWQRRFAKDQDVVGRTLSLNGKPFKVIGVTSQDFTGLQMDMPDIWAPLMMRPSVATGHFDGAAQKDVDWFGKQEFQWLSLHARLKPGKTMEEAKSELASLQDRLRPGAEAPGPKEFMSVAPAFRVDGKHSIWATMAVVLGASGLVLLIVCSNIANMLLARVASRQREIGVRLALGASRWRVIRQLLTESFLLALSGGAAGLLLAWWSIELLLPWVFGRFSERDFARTSLSLYPDWRVLVFAMLLSLASGLAFGLLPALRATRLDLPDLSVVIRDENAAFGGRIGRSWLRNCLVVAQVTLCFVLLIPAGLLLRGLSKVFGSTRGYATNKLLVVEYVLDDRIYGLSRVQEFQQQLMARIAALPGVQSVCPQRDLNGLVKIILPNKQGPGNEGKNGNQFEQVPFQWVTAEYLETIGTPLILGRGFSADEVVAESSVIIVSESTARNLWPGENPLGKTMRVEGRLRDGSVGAIMYAAQVIGVARDNQIYRDGHIPALFFYAPRTPPIPWPLTDQVVVGAVGDAASIKESVRKEASETGPVVRLSVGTMEGIIPASQSVKDARAASELAIALGGLALALAALGLYGVMAFGVGRRTREFGIRLALGAQARNVQMLVIAQGMRLVLIGVLIGVPIAMAVSQVMKSMLFGLSATDPTTYVGVALLLAMAGTMACWIPARRAAKVDPMNALRYE